MSRNIVRYNNGLNSIALREFSPVDMDIFWAICSKMKRKQTKDYTFSFQELKEIANYSQRGFDRFLNNIKGISEKLSTLSFYYEDEDTWEKLNLFQDFIVSKKNETLTIRVSERFEWILNSIGSNFTRFELENMTRLRSSYTKELYRQLMAHRDKKNHSGVWFVKVEDFRTLLAIPESFRMTNIDKRIFDVAEKEFLTNNEIDNRAIFSKFFVKKIKSRKGKKIASFQIYFEEKNDLPTISLHNWLEGDQ